MDIRLEPLVSEVEEACSIVLRSPIQKHLAGVFLAIGADPVEEARALTTDPATTRALTRLVDRILGSADRDVPTGAVEQHLIATAARAHVKRVPGLPLDADTRRDLLQYFVALLDPEPRIAEKMRVGHSWFISACKLLTGRRFPAGVYEFEVSGVPRSWLFRMRPRDLPRVLVFLSTRTRGLFPFFAPHLALLRDPGGHLTEDNVNQSYLRMAASMRLQPRIRGMLAAGWPRDPETAKVSPNLAVLSRPVVANGGIQFRLGRVDPATSGALGKSRRRREAFERGEWHPAIGVNIWPREAMLRWAEERSPGGQR